MRSIASLLAKNAEVCPTPGPDGGRRKFVRKRNPDPTCRICSHPRSKHERRHGRANMCLLNVPRGNTFKRKHTDRYEHVCELCGRPRGEHPSGAEAYYTLMSAAVAKTEADLDAYQDERMRIVW